MQLYIPLFIILNMGLVTAVPTPSNLTLPQDPSDDMIGWVSPTGSRNTWGIIWSCLSIFIVCSWKCLHLNIPTHEESLGKWHEMEIPNCVGSTLKLPYWPTRPLWNKWRRKLLWMLLIAIAPDIGVAIALSQYMNAKEDQDAARTRPGGENETVDVSGLASPKVDYSLAHAFYVNMGGVIVCDISPLPTDCNSTSAGRSVDLTLSRVTKVEIITSLKQLRDTQLVPSITEEDIRDRSKSDAFTKAFALLQCTWLVVQSIARAAQGYAVSQLELTTLAFIPCALIMYLLWWEKPYGIERRHIMLNLPKATTDFTNGLSFDIMIYSNQKSESAALPTERMTLVGKISHASCFLD